MNSHSSQNPFRIHLLFVCLSLALHFTVLVAGLGALGGIKHWWLNWIAGRVPSLVPGGFHLRSQDRNMYVRHQVLRCRYVR